MTNYAQHMQSNQREQAKSEQVVNNAGGFVFRLGPWKQLERWLILGAEGGTYYQTERALTRENAKTVQECLKLDAKLTIATIVAVSDAGRAPKNDSAIFALALAVLGGHAEAYAAIPKVCRIPTHLFSFVAACEALGKGWGRGFKRAIADWYNAKTPEQLAHDIAKYPQRGGWSHRDLLRLSHWNPLSIRGYGGADRSLEGSAQKAAIARYIVVGAEGMGERKVMRTTRASLRDNSKSESHRAGPDKFEVTYRPLQLPEYLQAFEELKSADGPRVIQLIAQHKFTHEMIDGKHKNSADVWEALLDANMPMTAMLRNLGKMSEVGLLKPLCGAVQKVTRKLLDQEALKKARVHPMHVLTALRVYQQGHGDKGSLHWKPVPQIVDALDEAFYLAFGVIPKTGKSFFVALDVSGSMGNPVSGIPNLSCREASAVMAMATVRTEPNYYVMGFAAGARGYGGMHGGDPCRLVDVKISARSRLDDVIAAIGQIPMGGTDCSLPMVHALKEGLDVDVFQVFTDNETWAGAIHPFQALKDYRQKHRRDSKLVVSAMTATPFTIADPNDGGMLDVVGFDSAAPAIIAEFARD